MPLCTLEIQGTGCKLLLAFTLLEAQLLVKNTADEDFWGHSPPSEIGLPHCTHLSSQLRLPEEHFSRKANTAHVIVHWPDILTFQVKCVAAFAKSSFACLPDVVTRHDWAVFSNSHGHDCLSRFGGINFLGLLCGIVSLGDLKCLSRGHAHVYVTQLGIKKRLSCRGDGIELALNDFPCRVSGCGSHSFLYF